MTPSNATRYRSAVLSAALVCVALGACGQESGPGSSPASAVSTEGPERCALLSDAAVAAVIGPHDGGQRGNLERPGAWGQDACIWTAQTAQVVDGWPDGWFDSLEVAVFHAYREAWAREKAEGVPIDGFPDGALYNESYGEVWFPCSSRFCALKLRTAVGRDRQENARSLALQVLENLRQSGRARALP